MNEDRISNADSEFRRFIVTLRILGIKYSFNWGPTIEKWQDILTRAGYNITALACNVIEVGDIELLFSSGKAHWTDDGSGHGPRGVFLLSRNKTTGEIQNRVNYKFADGELLPETGLSALRQTYCF